MNELHYEGYVIEALPKQLVDDDMWTIKINIWKHRGEKVTQKAFFAKNTFSDKDQAIAHCFDFGKQIIDGQIESCTVDDL